MDQLDYRLIFGIVLFVCLCVSAVIVWYFARHHPNPRFRPRLGEVVMVSVFAVGISGGLAALFANMLGSNVELSHQIENFKAPSANERRKASTSDDDEEMQEKKPGTDKERFLDAVFGKDKKK